MQYEDALADLRISYPTEKRLPPPDKVQEEPPLHTRYPIEIIREAYQLWKANGFGYPIPDPEVLMGIDPVWKYELYSYSNGVAFQREATERELGLGK